MIQEKSIQFQSHYRKFWVIAR